MLWSTVFGRVRAFKVLKETLYIQAQICLKMLRRASENKIWRKHTGIEVMSVDTNTAFNRCLKGNDNIYIVPRFAWYSHSCNSVSIIPYPLSQLYSSFKGFFFAYFSLFSLSVMPKTLSYTEWLIWYWLFTYELCIFSRKIWQVLSK
jgi:hypothetical protein